MSNDRSADALSAAAAFAIARSLYPSAIELVEYLLDHDNAEIRADVDHALATAARARERLRELAADRLGADGAAASEKIEALEIELDAERRKSVELESQVSEREAAVGVEKDCANNSAILRSPANTISTTSAHNCGMLTTTAHSASANSPRQTKSVIASNSS